MNSMLCLSILFTYLSLIKAMGMHFRRINADLNSKQTVLKSHSCKELDKRSTVVCMFTFDCMRFKGKAIGVCMDRPFVKSCCRLPVSPTTVATTRTTTTTNFTFDNTIIINETIKTTAVINNTTEPSSVPSLNECVNCVNETRIQTETKTTENFNETKLKTIRSTTNAPMTAKMASESTERNSYQTTDETTFTDMTTDGSDNFTEATIAKQTMQNFENITITEKQMNDTTETMIAPIENVTNSYTFGTESSTESSQIPELTTMATSTVTNWMNITQETITFNSTYTTSLDTTVTTTIASSFPATIMITTAVPTTPSTSVTRPYNNKLDCGVRPLRPDSRVVGGRNAYFGEWPWQVLIKEATWLGLFVKTKCGGVLIHHKWVLTAAHCQPGFLGSLIAIVGEYDLTGDVENLKPVAKPIKRMIIHRDYNPNTFENDIALLELETKFDIQPHVVPICLPDDTEDFVGQMAHVAGWGKLSYGGPIPSILQVVKLPVLPNSQCQQMFLEAGHVKAIRDTFLCAGYKNGGKDACEGDSGGPLMTQRSNGHWVLIGTVSHGIKCAEPNLPGVYMRTSAYKPWIRRVTGDKIWNFS